MPKFIHPRESASSLCKDGLSKDGKANPCMVNP
uniref:Uncharacterized protein n=1 Tax=Arundo donax TaxID=35708 RepID=A0A0A9CHM3_ARUDO